MTSICKNFIQGENAMRWRKKLKPFPKNGDTREVTKFLWFPKTIDNETRWLERTTWIQEYVVTTGWDIPNFWMDRTWGLLKEA